MRLPREQFSTNLLQYMYVQVKIQITRQKLCKTVWPITVINVSRFTFKLVHFFRTKLLFWNRYNLKIIYFLLLFQ